MACQPTQAPGRTRTRDNRSPDRYPGAVELIFLGTRGEIDISSCSHRRHSALLVLCGKNRILIDCGADWLHHFEQYRPTEIFLTHAHPDHAWGLSDGAPCPVYATRRTHAILADCIIHERRILLPLKSLNIGGLRVEAFPVRHSIRAPAVGYRISSKTSCFFYVPDVVAIPRRAAALHDVQIYIGDGASIKRPLIRRKGSQLFGHTSVATQIGWCEKEGVRQAIFTHCGTEIVGGNGRKLRAVVARLGQERGVDARIAHDGLRVVLNGDDPWTPAEASRFDFRQTMHRNDA